MKLKIYTRNNIETVPQIKTLPSDVRHCINVISEIFPFRVNQYVIDELIDWAAVPDDPIFRLVFPQQGMLKENVFREVKRLQGRGAETGQLSQFVNSIQRELNPHPGNQLDYNVPTFKGEPLKGIQHKYEETVLFFPSQGQTCHSYCSFCFRWPQFIRDSEFCIRSKEADTLHRYLKNNKNISDLLLTGGDPMVMKASILERYLEPLLQPEFDHIKNIRIGTKSLTYWPQRYVTDADSCQLLQLIEKVVKAGKHIAIMAHYNHWREMETPISQQAIRLLQDAGAVIRTQGPLLAGINDEPEVWARMWKQQVSLGMVPYYMFVERNTGANYHFEVPLHKAWTIYRDAIKNVSGLARTVRGPSMSTVYGKIEVQGLLALNNEKFFVLRFIQGRNKDWVQSPFLANYDTAATWIDELTPAYAEEKFFFQ